MTPSIEKPYCEIDFGRCESEGSEARNSDTFSVDELLGDVAAQRSPDRPHLLVVSVRCIKAGSHPRLKRLLNLRGAVGSTLEIGLFHIE